MTRLCRSLLFVLATLPPYPERRYGDRLQLTGELKTPRAPKRPGEFDYQKYLARKQIFSLMQPKAVALVSQNNGQPLLAALLGWAALTTATIYPHVPRNDWDGALHTLAKLVAAHGVNLIAIGNGTASRETDKLAAEQAEGYYEAVAAGAGELAEMGRCGARGLCLFAASVALLRDKAEAGRRRGERGALP